MRPSMIMPLPCRSTRIIPFAYNNRAYAYLVKGDFDKAITSATKAISLDAGYETPYVNRARAYLKKGNKIKAREDFSKACKMGNDDGCRELQAVK